MEKLTAQDARIALDKADQQEPGMSLPIVKGLLVDAIARIEALELECRQARAACMRMWGILKAAGLVATNGANGAQPQAPAVAAPEQPKVRVGADGMPVTGEQLAAEEAMDAAIAAGGGSVEQAQPQSARQGNRPTPPRGGVRVPPPAPAEDKVYVGADGNVITDPAQIEAERAMDEAAGPRQ